MIDRYPTGMLLNVSTGRIHPIVFRSAPFPGGQQPGGGGRYCSHGHHTAGFATLTEARAWAEKQGTLRVIDRTWEWDGASIPALVEFFDDNETENKS